jgi:hypothetical protein
MFVFQLYFCEKERRSFFWTYCFHSSLKAVISLFDISVNLFSATIDLERIWPLLPDMEPSDRFRQRAVFHVHPFIFVPAFHCNNILYCLVMFLLNLRNVRHSGIGCSVNRMGPPLHWGWWLWSIILNNE